MFPKWRKQHLNTSDFVRILEIAHVKNLDGRITVYLNIDYKIKKHISVIFYSLKRPDQT